MAVRLYSVFIDQKIAASLLIFKTGQHIMNLILKSQNDTTLFYYDEIQLTSSQVFGSAPALSKHLMISIFPLSAAICNGVAPPALTFGFAPAYIAYYSVSF